ncbi:MAG: glycosyltransferase family 4 protein [Deltaproteobacteria bacterium]|nr:glycosyltransferase family 4 protein [Deltaproteobacteria bacterium]
MAHLAYYFSTFPALTTTFAQHQVRATEKLGLRFILAANRPPEPRQFHPEDEDLRQRTFYLTPVRPWTYLEANLQAWRRWPRRYAQSLPLALQLRNGSFRQPLKNFVHLAGAAVLAEHLLDNPLLEEKLRRARFIVSNCNFHVENLRRRFPSLERQRFYVVYGGLDLQAGPWSKPEPPGADLPLRILHIGRLVPVKAQEVLIQALARLRDQGGEFWCRMVGDGPRRDGLQSLVASLNLQDRVQLLGDRFADEVARLHEWSQVLVLSSRSEGTPMVIMEAMAKARPVIAPRLTAIPEMVADGRTGYLFPPGDIEGLAAKLARLMAQPEAVVHLGQEGRRRAEELFDLDRNARELLAVFARELPGMQGCQEVAAG